ERVHLRAGEGELSMRHWSRFLLALAHVLAATLLLAPSAAAQQWDANTCESRRPRMSNCPNGHAGDACYRELARNAEDYKRHCTGVPNAGASGSSDPAASQRDPLRCGTEVLDS